MGTPLQHLHVCGSRMIWAENNITTTKIPPLIKIPKQQQQQIRGRKPQVLWFHFLKSWKIKAGLFFAPLDWPQEDFWEGWMCKCVHYLHLLITERWAASTIGKVEYSSLHLCFRLRPDIFASVVKTWSPMTGWHLSQIWWNRRNRWIMRHRRNRSRDFRKTIFVLDLLFHR